MDARPSYWTRLRFWVPYIVLVGALLMTLGAYHYASQVSREADSLRFQSRSHRTLNAVEARMDAYLALLEATAGFFMASDSVHLSAFRAYLAKTEVQHRYPGIQGVGYTARFHASEIQRMQQVLGTLYPGFRFWPDEPRAEWHAIVYLEPQDRRNQVAIGYDMFSEPVRNEAMVRARDTGQPAVSGTVTLVQEIDAEVQAGFLAYVPVYGQPHAPESIEERRQNLRGFVYSPFRAADLFRGIFQYDPLIMVGFEIYVGTQVDPSQLLYASENLLRANEGLRMTAEQTIVVGGQDWTVRITSLPEFAQFSHAGRARMVGIAGVLMSILLFLITLIQARASHAVQHSAERLDRSRRALRESEEKFRQIVETAREGIWVFDADGRTEYVNEQMAWLLATTPERLQERTLLDYLEAENPSGIMVELNRGAPEIAAEDLCLRREDGQAVWVRFSASRLVDDNTGRKTTLVMVSDVTDRKEYEDELIEEKERAEELARLKSAFLANMSHEIRTPLTGIIGFSQLLAEEVTGEHRSYADSIGRSGQRLLETLNSILDLANFEARGTEDSVEIVSVAPVLRETRALMEPLAAKKRLGFEVVIHKDDVGVEVVPVHLRRILSNLVGNAIKFTDQGEVRLSLDADDEQAVITVADTGIGVDPAFLPRIFEEFMQESTGLARSHEGTGLGLTIAKRLVELMGGRIEVESKKGVGSTFRVFIPRATVAEDFSTDGNTTVMPSAQAYRNSRLLVVEDNEVTRLLFSKLLMPLAEVSIARNAQEALAELESRRFDLLLIDINLGRGLSGLDLLTRVRAGELHKDVPAIALTAYALPGDRERFIEGGFNTYLAKPFVRKELFELLDRFLGKPAARIPAD